MILVAGEALIDMLPATDADGARLLRPAPGGSPFNVALALGRLGAPVRFLCPLSRDAFGRELRATLAGSAVDLSACPETDALSTIGFVTTDPSTGRNDYAFYTNETAGCALSVSDLPLPLNPATRAVHVGSFSIAVEPFGSAIDALVEALPRDRVLSLDPNIRPFLIPDRSSFLKRLTRLLARADLVKLSLEDLQWLHPGSTQEDVAAQILSQGASLVVITLGAEGAIAFTSGLRVRAKAPPTEVVDTVGAGDTFQAALLAWLFERGALERERIRGLGEGDLQSMLAFACAAAALNCARPGCDPPRRSELTF
jgi:fructokinase